MSACPYCGKPVPDSAGRDEHCSTCFSPMETGATNVDDFQPVPHANDCEPVKPVKVPHLVKRPRPPGITMFAIFYYLCGGWLLAQALGLVVRRNPGEIFSIQALVILDLFGSLLFLAVGFALMTLRHWGQKLAIAISVVSLLLGVDSRLLQIVCLLYLLQPDVKACVDEAENPSFGYRSPDRLGLKT